MYDDLLKKNIELHLNFPPSGDLSHPLMWMMPTAHIGLKTK